MLPDWDLSPHPGTLPPDSCPSSSLRLVLWAGSGGVGCSIPPWAHPSPESPIGVCLAPGFLAASLERQGAGFSLTVMWHVPSHV